MRRILFIVLFSCLFAPLQAHAHKVNVFAWVSGDTVTVESRLSGNTPLQNSKVIVTNKQSEEILIEGTGDKKGIFTFTIPTEVKGSNNDLLITVSGGDGHQAQWLLPASEFSTVTTATTVSQPTSTMGLNNRELQLMLRQLFDEELAPIKRSLAKAEEKKTDFRDILGGLGYLLGLAGLITWFKNKK
jgi:nickel transport protein